MAEDVKIIFMGTPDFSVPVLEGLIENYNVVAVVTQPDATVGRTGKITESPVKKIALEHNIDILQPTKIRNEYQMVLDYEPDIIITCAYGQIIPKEIIDYPKYKCINVHASLLPKYRGGAPIHHAIINGEDKTGITVMHMDYGMDDGDILTTREVTIEYTDTAESLFNKLRIIGRELLLETLPSILDNSIKPIKQNEAEVTFAYNIKPEDEAINFNKTTREVYNQIRGLNSWPGGYVIFNDKRLKVWAGEESTYSGKEEVGAIVSIDNGLGIKTKTGKIILTEIQPEGKKRMNSIDFINGYPNKKELINTKLN